MLLKRTMLYLQEFPNELTPAFASAVLQKTFFKCGFFLGFAVEEALEGMDAHFFELTFLGTGFHTNGGGLDAHTFSESNYGLDKALSVFIRVRPVNERGRQMDGGKTAVQNM